MQGQGSSAGYSAGHSAVKLKQGGEGERWQDQGDVWQRMDEQGGSGLGSSGLGGQREKLQEELQFYETLNKFQTANK